MRVFSVEMLVKEEGAATVQAALNRLKKETQAVAAEMKATTQSVTTTGRAMSTVGTQTEISGGRAAKAAIGFAAVGQSVARTGSLTADAGTRIIEAGSQIAAMFGPGGLVVAGILAGLAAITAGFFGAKKEVAAFKQKLDEMTNTANLQGLQDELDKIVKGTASKEGRDALAAQATELAKLQQQYGYLANKLTSEMTPAEIEARTRIRELREEVQSKRDAIFDLQNRIKVASDVERFHTEVVDAEAEAEKRATEATKARTEALKALDEAVKRNAAVRGAIQEREQARLGTMPSTVGMTTFGTGLGVAGTTAEAAARNAPDIAKQTAESFKAQMDAEMQGITQGLANTTIPIDDALMQAVKFDDLKNTLADGIGQSIEGGILSGLEMGLASGSISEGFRAMGQAIVSSMAQAMVKVAVAAIKLGTLMEKIRVFMIAHPAIAVASAIALLALAKSMGGGASGAGMSAIGGAGGLTYGAAGAMGSSLPTQQIIFGATSATTAAGMTPRSSMNVTVIGPNDPSAQRAIQELMNKANSRGSIG